MQDYDLIVAGAGVVGAALAASLAVSEAGQHLRIALIEANTEKKQFSGKEFDPRVYALTHASQDLFQEISCWDEILSRRACAYREMRVWDGEGTAQINFDAAEVHQAQLGHIVENSVLVNVLHERIKTLPKIDFYCPDKISTLDVSNLHSKGAVIRLDTDKKITASLVVGADGAHSNLRELAGFSLREKDYKQQAIVTTVCTERSHNYTAWQRFMHTGPLAFLPLQELPLEKLSTLKKRADSHWCSIVWSADSDLAEYLMSLNEIEFCKQLTSSFEGRLGQVLSCAKRYAIPLRQRHATSYIQPGVVLVGDAAHSVHPLAGQGVNLGLLDVRALVQEINRAIQRSVPLTDYSILRRYQRQRLTNNQLMMTTMDAFHYLFRNPSLAINWLRNFGLDELNSLNVVKKAIVRAAL